jgi:mRNA-decapping enzyme subunit 2
MEEVGFDMKDRAFEDQYLERELNGQIVRLYIVKQVPRETKFVSKTKNEIKVSRRLSFDLNAFEVFFSY